MKISILTTEKVQSSYTKEAIKEYEKRLKAFTKMEYIVAKNPLKEIPQRAYIIEINPKGESITSEELASHMNDLMVHGQSHIVFLLNTSLDISSDFTLAISKMNMDSDILSIIIYEQIFRAFSILNGRPYHK